MCGIVGEINHSLSKDEIKQHIEKMLNITKHRGPDNSGYDIKDGIGVGVNRLSIIDVLSGDMPIYNQDKSVLIIQNGEIYNYKPLKKLLCNKGHIFKTNSDTEVILYIYEEFGKDGFDLLKGMFAFAICDFKKNELILARDSFGIKPLFYYSQDNQFLFSSELKGFLPIISFEINPNAVLDLFTYRYIIGPSTVVKNIFEVPPGHYLTLKLDNKQFFITKFFREKSIDKTSLSLEESTEILYQKLFKSVEDHLQADVPVGVFLSGGIDSSVIAAIASKIMGENCETFSVGFEEKNFNEFYYSDLVAKTLNTKHHKITIDSNKFCEIIPSILWYNDEPIADPANLPVMILSQEARKYVKVVLSGEGGDELFGGYPQYIKIINDLKLYGYQHGKDFKFNIDSEKTFKDRFFQHSWYLQKNLAQNVLNPDFYAFSERKNNELYDPTHKLKSFLKEESPLKSMLEADLGTWMPDNLLKKIDRMTMMNSLEARVPYLYQELKDFTDTLHDNWKINEINGVFETKYILKKVAERLLPKEVVYRQKMGFPVPLDQHLQNNLTQEVMDTFKSKKFNDRGIFDPNVLIQEYEKFIENNSTWTSKWVIWLSYLTEKWCQYYIDRNPPTSCQSIL